MKKSICLFCVILSLMMVSCSNHSGQEDLESVETFESEEKEEFVLPKTYNVNNETEEYLQEEQSTQIDDYWEDIQTEVEYEDDGFIYVDIDNDGIEEKTEYIAKENLLRISKKEEQILEVDLYDYGVDFNGIGMHTALYYYEYVRDSNDKVYLHIYTSALIGDDDAGNRYTSANESYYEIKDNKLNLVDLVEYKWIWDYRSTDSEKIDISINGQNSDLIEEIEMKYTIIDNTYFEIPY